MTTTGTWYLTSAMDPRWNYHGHYVGWQHILLPAECSGRIRELESALGEQPADLHFSFELESVEEKRKKRSRAGLIASLEKLQSIVAQASSPAQVFAAALKQKAKATMSPDLKSELESAKTRPDPRAIKILESEIKIAVILATAKFREATGGPAPKSIQIEMLPVEGPDYVVGCVTAEME